jgi:hypothetical protein
MVWTSKVGAVDVYWQGLHHLPAAIALLFSVLSGYYGWFVDFGGLCFGAMLTGMRIGLHQRGVQLVCQQTVGNYTVVFPWWLFAWCSWAGVRRPQACQAASRSYIVAAWDQAPVLICRLGKVRRASGLAGSDLLWWLEVVRTVQLG